MSIENTLEIASAVLLALGGGGAIVLALSNWLGKVWADRLMAQETQRHSKELETLRASLQAQVDHFSQIYKQKIDLYKEVAEPLINLIVKVEHTGTLTQADLRDFDVCRLKTTALLAMFAPTNVFNEYNGLIDYIYDSVEGKAAWSFGSFRDRALKFLSLVRADIGIYADAVSYNGLR